MATEDMVQQEAPEQESHWQALPWLLGGLAGLSALVVAIGAGLWADNDAVTILIRAVIAMGTCWMAGWGAGWLVQRAVHADSGSVCDEVSGDCRDSDDSIQAEDSMAETQVRREAA